MGGRWADNFKRLQGYSQEGGGQIDSGASRATLDHESGIKHWSAPGRGGELTGEGGNHGFRTRETSS